MNKKLSVPIAVILLAVIICVGKTDYMDTVASEKESNTAVEQTLKQTADIKVGDILLNNNAKVAWTVLAYYYPDVELQEYFSDDYPELDPNITYWLIITEEIGGSIREWIESENMNYREICAGGELGQTIIYVYKVSYRDKK